MATRRFEDLAVYVQASEMTRRVYALTGRPPLRQDFALCNQLRRAANSVKANIAEGYERGRRGELHQYLTTAKGSCGETRSHLHTAFEVGFLPREEYIALVEITESLSRRLGAFRASVARQRDRMTPPSAHRQQG